MGDELKVIIDSANCSSSLSKMQGKEIWTSHLVELQHIKKLEQLPVLLRVLQLDIVLPQPVQGELGLIVDVHLHRLQTRDDILI